MEIFKNIDESLSNVETKNFNYDLIKDTLTSSKATINSLLASNRKNLTCLEQNSEEIKYLKETLQEKTNRLNKSSNHNEYLEPLFQKFKEQSIGRLELLNLSDDIAEDLKFKINKAEYTDEIMELLLSIELKTKETLAKMREKIPLNRVISKNVNMKNFKSGK